MKNFFEILENVLSSEDLDRVLRELEDVEKQTEIQTLILSKDVFETKEEANRWVREHDFKIKEGAPEETENSWRYRQKDPGEFQDGSLRTIELTDGVKAVVGLPKEERSMNEKRRKAVERGNELLAPFEATVEDVHSLEFPIERFRDLASAKVWAKNHGIPVLRTQVRRDRIVIVARSQAEFQGESIRREVVGKSRVRVDVGTPKTSGVTKAVPDSDASNEEKREAQAARSERWGIEALEGKGENLSFPSGGPTDEADYADPVNLKYPVHTEANAANARVRFKQNADVYEQEKSKAIVHERIVRAELRFGIEPSFDPDDPLDALLPGDLKDQLSKARKNLAERRFSKRADLIVVSKQADGSDVPDDEVRMFGIVMKPEVPDADGTVTSHAEIESANLQFMRDFGTLGLMHAKAIGGTNDGKTDRVSLVQNVIAPIDFEFPTDGGAKAIARGTWYQELWSNDPDIVKAVKVEKTLTGLSIGGFAKTVPVTEFVDGRLVVNVPENYSLAQKRAIKEIVAKAEGDPALDRFVDLRVEEVSLVDAAANEEEFFIIKRRKEMGTKDKPAATEKDKAAKTPEPTPEPTTKGDSEPTTKGDSEPSIADQISTGFQAGVKAVLEEVRSTAPAAPEPAPEPAPAAESGGNGEILGELKKLNERMDGLEAAQKAAGTARAVAKGEAAPEDTASPAETQEPSSKWAGTAIHSTFGKKK